MKSLILTSLSILIFSVACTRELDQKDIDPLVKDYLERNGLDFLDQNLTALIEKRVEEGRLKEEKSILEAYRHRQKVVLLKNTAVTGVKEAPLEVVLFGHFQDPFTRTFYKTLKKLMKDEYSENMKLGFRHHISKDFKDSEAAAKAAEAARMQSKFWEMAEVLFENQDKLSDKSLENYARAIGLDVAQFNKDRNSKAVKDIVFEDTKYVSSRGAAVTPSYFVNGAVFFGAREERRIKHILDTLLKVEKGEIKVSERY